MAPVKSGEAPAAGAPAPADRAEPFVGRAHELDAVRRACEGVRADGRGRLVVVSGERGVGTTRLCAEVAARARRSGVRVVEARCWTGGGAPPLWPWPSIVDDLCGAGPGGLATASGGAAGFARFAAVADLLADAGRAAPTCVVIDDVHAADDDALDLLLFVARHLARVPLLLVVGRGDGEPAGDGDRARRLDELEREATSVVLPGFDRAETAAFLRAQGIGALPDDVATVLHRLTRGHPVRLDRVARALRAGGDAPALEDGVRVAVDDAGAGLAGEAGRLLSVAALLGDGALVADVAAVAGCDAVAVVEAVDAAADAGLVVRPAGERIRFGHELVRRAVERDLGAADRFDAHARAAAVLSSPEAGASADRLARAADHARRAAPRSRDDARRAVALCEAAARAMVRDAAYARADELYSAAVEQHTAGRLGTPPALLTLEWAQAAALQGHHEVARDRYRAALARAGVEDRPGLLAEAALGAGGLWLGGHASDAERRHVLGVYGTALDRLPVDDARYATLRCRLRTRLAAEEAHAGGPAEPLLEALAAARASGDPRTHAEALALTRHGLFSPEHAHRWCALTDELLDVAAITGQDVPGLVGMLWRVVDQLHLGDPRFIRSLEGLHERAATLGNDHMRYHAAIVDVLVDIGQGRLAQAERAADRCAEQGRRIGRADALPYRAAQLGTIRWLQGREGDILDHVDGMASAPVLAETEFSTWALAACLAARAGEHDRARAVLHHCLPRPLADLARSGTWTVGLVALIEAAAALGDRDLAARAYDLLLPHAHLPAVAGLGIVCLGSNERPLGVAAGVIGDHDAAVAHLERALVANQRLVNHSLLTLTRAELAEALLRRGAAPAAGGDPRDVDRASELLRRAIEDGARFGMTGRVAAWEARLAEVSELDRRPVDPLTTAAATAQPPADPRPQRGEIRREGRRWTLAVDGRRIRVADLVGMRYLAVLLTSPGQRVPAAALAGRATDPSPAGRHELLDEQARATYAARARELSTELADAEAANDLHRAERLRLELDALVDQLEAATGLNGRPRHFADDHERARVAVQKAIKRAVDAVADADPALAELLRESVSTGVTCCYAPDGDAPVVWTGRAAGAG